MWNFFKLKGEFELVNSPPFPDTPSYLKRTPETLSQPTFKSADCLNLAQQRSTMPSWEGQGPHWELRSVNEFLFNCFFLIFEIFKVSINDNFTYFREDGENGSEEVGDGELDKEVVHP